MYRWLTPTLMLLTPTLAQAVLPLRAPFTRLECLSFHLIHGQKLDIYRESMPAALSRLIERSIWLRYRAGDLAPIDAELDDLAAQWLRELGLEISVRKDLNSAANTFFLVDGISPDSRINGGLKALIEAQKLEHPVSKFAFRSRDLVTETEPVFLSNFREPQNLVVIQLPWKTLQYEKPGASIFHELGHRDHWVNRQSVRSDFAELERRLVNGEAIALANGAELRQPVARGFSELEGLDSKGAPQRVNVSQTQLVTRSASDRELPLFVRFSSPQGHLGGSYSKNLFSEEASTWLAGLRAARRELEESVGSAEQWLTNRGEPSVRAQILRDLSERVRAPAARVSTEDTPIERIAELSEEARNAVLNDHYSLTCGKAETVFVVMSADIDAQFKLADLRAWRPEKLAFLNCNDARQPGAARKLLAETLAEELLANRQFAIHQRAVFAAESQIVRTLVKKARDLRRQLIRGNRLDALLKRFGH